MKPILTKAILALIASAALAALVPAQQRPSSVSVLGKNDYQALLEAAPGIPATPADAAKRVYGPDIKIQEDPAVLDSFYAPFYQRVAAARDVIKEAVENRTQSQEALLAESRAQANASPIVSRMAGWIRSARCQTKRRSRPPPKLWGAISRVSRVVPAILHPACR